MLFGYPFLSDGINSCKIELFVVCSQIIEQLEYLFLSQSGVSRRLINFVNNNDWLQSKFQRFL